MLRGSLVLKASALAAATLLAVGIAAVPARKVSADQIPVYPDYFPDNKFMSYVSSFDTNHDNVLSDDELRAVDTIDVSNRQIKSLDGIQYFTNLEELSCSDNMLESLDLSHNTKLRKLGCSGNKIKTLNLTNNPLLRQLDCTSIYLKEVNITGCQKLLKNIELGMTHDIESVDPYGHFVGFERMIDSEPNVLVFTVTTYVTPKGYTDCYFRDTKFRDKVDAACDGNSDGWLTKTELAGVESLNVSSLGITDLTGLELLENLYYFNCSKNAIAKIDVSKNTKLSNLDCSDNQLSDLDLTNNKELTSLSCCGNKISILDAGDLPKLCFLEAISEDLEGICFKGSTFIEKVYSEATPEELGSMYGPNLRYEMSGNYLCFSSGIDIGIAVNIHYFPDEGFRKCVAQSIDPDRNGILTDAEIKAINKIAVTGKSIDDITGIEYFTELTTLQCDDNRIKELDLSHNTKLEILRCGENYIYNLDFSNNKELTYLDCSDSAMEKLNVSQNLKLATLYCGLCKLESLDVSNNTELKDLDCQSTLLDKLDVTNNPKLESLYCGNVLLKTLAIYNCPNILDAFLNGEITGQGTSWAGYDWVLYKHNGMEFCFNTDLELILVKPTATPTPSATATPTATAAPTAVPTTAPASVPSGAPTAAPTAAAADVSLKLDKETVNVVCGKTLTLKATLTGSSEKITWKTSDKKIATVDANGKISAKMGGTVTITATAAGKSAACVVTVLYKDVTKTKDFWFAPTNYLTAKGVVKGYDKQTKFKPANKCTRAQMVTFIWRLMGEPAPKAKTCKFKDVKKTDYFYKACIWGNENHIVEGYKNGTFGPQIVCARKHAVTFLWRLAGQPKPSSTKNKFKDVKEKDYFYRATLWASEKGILAGYKDGTFKPNGDCLRRQMVTFLYKYDKFINGKG